MRRSIFVSDYHPRVRPSSMRKLSIHPTVYAIYFASPNFSRIGTSRHFREWVNSRSRRRAMDGSEVNLFSRVVEFAKSTDSRNSRK